MGAVRNTLGNVGSKITLYPISFFTSIVIARYLGPDDRGVYAYIATIISFMTPVVTFGIGGGIVYFISKNEYKVSDALFTVFLIAIAFGFISSVGIYILWEFNLLGKAGSGITLIEIIYVIVSIFFSTIIFFGGRILIASNNFKILNTLDILKNITIPVLMLLLVYVFSLRLHGVFLTMVIVNVLFGSITMVYFLKKEKISPIVHFDFIRKASHYGFKGWFGDMAIRANVRFDQLILGATLAPSNLGIYSIAVLLSELIWVVPDSVGPVLFNLITKIRDDQEKLDITTRITRLLFGFSICAGTFLIAVSYWLLIPYGYGPEYHGVMNLLLLLIPASIFMIFTKTTTKILSGSGNIAQTSMIQIISAGVGILCYIAFIRPFGTSGAAMATLVSYFTGAFYSFYILRKNYSLRLSRLILLDKSDIIWAVSCLKNIRNPTKI